MEYDKQDSLAIITLRRPEKRNAIDSELSDEIGEALTRFENDTEADVGVLYGVGGSFSSGTDMKSCSMNSVKPTWSKVCNFVGCNLHHLHIMIFFVKIYISRFALCPNRWFVESAVTVSEAD